MIDTAADLLAQVLDGEECVSKKALAINGKDIIAMGVPQGVAVGQILEALFQRVLAGDVPNEREILIDYARELVSDWIGRKL